MINERTFLMVEIIRFCGLSRDETRIRNRFSLNSVQAEAYLSILKQQKMLMQNNGKYEITERGISFLTSCDKINGIKQKIS
jgi:predicted transcriptional regulator